VPRINFSESAVEIVKKVTAGETGLNVIGLTTETGHSSGG